MPMPRSLPPALPRAPPIRLGLGIGLVCIAVEAALSGADAGLWGERYWRARVYENGAFWAGLLFDWRPNYAAQPGAMFLSYGFLHGGPWHLLGNMAALALLLRNLGPRLDAARLLALWAGASVGGGLAFAALGPVPVPMVGASGALFGLAGAWLVWDAAALKAAGLSRRPVWRALLILVLLHPVLWLAQAGMLAWQTHLGGFLAGAALARATGPARGSALRLANKH